MPYATFTVEEFCKDPDFIRWVVTPSTKSNRFWRAFMVEYPDKVADIRLASQYVRTIQFREINPSEQDLARLKQRIWRSIDRPVRVVRWYQRPYWAAAAVVLLIVSVSMGWWAYQANAGLTYRTAYGKIQEIRLADGSVVTLNANSSLRVADDLTDTPVREVWLDGEAYFTVAKRKVAKFTVHTAEAQIDVLGTEFNVNTRREQTKVVLHEGKVRLSRDNVPAIVMKPGDMATVTSKSRKIQLKSVQPAMYDAWKESYIVLDNKSLPEIINALEDTFGVTIKLADTLLVNKKLTGKLRLDAADDCISNLAVILEADVNKAGDTYLFK